MQEIFFFFIIQLYIQRKMRFKKIMYIAKTKVKRVVDIIDI